MPKKRLCCRIDDTLYNSIYKIIENEDLKISQVVEDALKSYVDSHNNELSIRGCIVQLIKTHDKLYPDNKLMRSK